MTSPPDPGSLPAAAEHPSCHAVPWVVTVTVRDSVGAVHVDVSSNPVPTPPGTGLVEALGRLEPAVLPFEEVVVRIDGDLGLLVKDPDLLDVLLRLPVCVGRVEALGHVFELRDREGSAMWRLALRLLQHEDQVG